MPDQPLNELPRVALVYGQAATVEHVRDAVEGQVEVVYATAAREFDGMRMTAARATAALVNLDDGDWLGDVEARLHDAGVAVVYNDPEISRGLDGWERARWLRHLVAKLSGSREVDPPRPASVESVTPVGAGDVTLPAPPAVLAQIASGPAPAGMSPTTAAVVADLPLSSEEIESMTVALAAEADPANISLPEAAAVAPQSSAELMAMDMAVEEAAASAADMRTAASAGADSAQPVSSTPSQDADFDADNGLDVDTETLSAMIDARLAESEAATPSDSPQVWRVVGGGAVSPVQLEDAGQAVTMAPASVEPSVVTPAAAVPADDADVLASLPSLDDWALVDPEVPTAKAGTEGNKVPEPALLDGLAGLELVPMETVVPVHIHTDPIERWLHASEPVKPRVESDTAAKASGGKS